MESAAHRSIAALYNIQEARVRVFAAYSSTEDEPEEFAATFPTSYTLQQIHDALQHTLLSSPQKSTSRCPHVTLEIENFAYVQTPPRGKRRVSDTIPVMHVALGRPHSIFQCPDDDQRM